MAAITNTLKQQMVDDLARSGLVLDDVFGAQSVGPEKMLPLPGVRDMDLPAWEDDEGYDPDDDAEVDLVVDKEAEGGYTIPYFTLSGEPVMDRGKQFQRVRLLGQKNKDVPRYRSPKGSSNHVYIPQRLRDLLAGMVRQATIQRASDPDGMSVLTLYITEGEKKAIRAVKSGLPCIAIPGVYMWSDSEKVQTMKREYAAAGGNPKDIKVTSGTPINPELLAVIEATQQVCPNIGIVCVLFDSDGLPLLEKQAFTKAKGELVPSGNIDWNSCTAPGKSKDHYVSANPQVTGAGMLLAAALRRQCLVRAVVTTRFCPWDKVSSPENWKKQGLDDWLQANGADKVRLRLDAGLENAKKLWGVVQDEPLFSCNADPDELGAKGGPSTEIAFSRLLDGANVGQADGLLYGWVGSHWQMVDQRRLERAAHMLMDAFYAEGGTARKASDAPKLAVSAPKLYQMPDPRTKYDVDDAIIPCKDVTLDISGKGVVVAREPRRDDGLRYCVNVNWADRDQPCPMFLKFIESTLPDAGVRGLVQQYIGYTLIGDTRYDIAQWWFGSGANGKSVLAEIVSALHRKVASANLADLSGFHSEGLLDASLITIDETPKRIDEQNLKKSISSGEQDIDRKYNTSVTVKLRAKWLLRGNDKPSLSDQTDGLWRRLHIIHFEQKFTGKDKDPLLLEKILKHELAGVLNWAIEGLVKVLKAGRFVDVPAQVWAWKKEMQVETNSVLGWWVDKEVRACDTPTTDKDAVYDGYNTWCRKNGLMPVGSIVFWRRIHAIVGEQGAKLVERKGIVAAKDPFTGGSERLRVRLVNIDLSVQDDEGILGNVFPIQRPATATKPPAPIPVMVPAAAAGYVELDDAELDLNDPDTADVGVVVSTAGNNGEDQPLFAPDTPPDKAPPVVWGDVPPIPGFTQKHMGTVRPVKIPAARKQSGGVK